MSPIEMRTRQAFFWMLLPTFILYGLATAVEYTHEMKWYTLAIRFAVMSLLIVSFSVAKITQSIKHAAYLFILSLSFEMFLPILLSDQVLSYNISWWPVLIVNALIISEKRFVWIVCSSVFLMSLMTYYRDMDSPTPSISFNLDIYRYYYEIIF